MSTYNADMFEGDTLEAKLINASEAVEFLESEVGKLRGQLRKAEANNSQLQEQISTHGSNKNNTSSAFLLPSEFKNLWYDMLQNLILDAFGDFFESHFDLAFLVKDIIQISYQTLQTRITGTFTKIWETLSLPEQQTEGLRQYMLKYIQDNHSVIFTMNWDQSDKMIKQYRDRALLYVSDLELLDQILHTSEFKGFMERLHDLGLHMLLSDPPVEYDFPQELDYREYNDKLCWIDGFVKGHPKCVVIVPSLSKGGKDYLGIQPGVLILGSGQTQLTHEEQKDRQKPATRSHSLRSQRTSRSNFKENIPALDMTLNVKSMKSCRRYGKGAQSKRMMTATLMQKLKETKKKMKRTQEEEEKCRVM